jgi:hypothetical protein
VGFLRLSNSAQAERAADWIGREYKLVWGQFTETQGENRSRQVGGSRTQTTTDTVGENRSKSVGKQGIFTSSNVQTGVQHSTAKADAIGESWSETEGGSQERGKTLQRVYEHNTEPDVLKTLPSSEIVLVEFGRNGRRVINADFSPEVALLPRVSVEPMPDQVLAQLGRQ